MEWHFGVSVTGVEPSNTVHGVRNAQTQSTILVYRSGKSKLISFPFSGYHCFDHGFCNLKIAGLAVPSEGQFKPDFFRLEDLV